MKELPPATEVPLEDYDSRVVAAPVLRGLQLQAFALVAETSLFNFIYPSIANKNGLPEIFDVVIPEAPLFTSIPSFTPKNGDFLVEASSDSSVSIEKEWRLASHSANLTSSPTANDYFTAYTKGATTPVEVAERIISFLQAQPQLSWLVSWSADEIRSAASRSAERWAVGAPASPLDGVPFAVKDFIDVLPYPTTGGTKVIAKRRPVVSESPYVARLKRLGAICLGKTNAVEIGLGVLGINPHYGTPVHPMVPGHMCGGSSTGSAAMVAAGLCPFAVGTDGGGSIRVPAALCGVVGLKPTHGAMSVTGCVKVDSTVSTSGPLAASVADAALLYAVMGSCREASDQPVYLPAEGLGSTEGRGTPLTGIKIGVYKKWFDDAQPAIVSVCQGALSRLQALGAALADVSIPELHLARLAHSVTIVSEMANFMAPYREDTATWRQVGAQQRVSLAMSRYWTAKDYLQAQRIRRRLQVHFERAFQAADYIATPTTGCTAPAINPAAYKYGESNIGLELEIMKYVQPANMLGLPAITIPVGTDEKGLPVGLQVMGPHGSEGRLLALGAALEASLRAAGQCMPTPAIGINPLTGVVYGQLGTPAPKAQG